MIPEVLAMWLALAPSATSPEETKDTPSAAASRRPVRLLRFIGEQQSFERMDCLVLDWPDRDREEDFEDEATAGEQCDEDDLHYRASYRVRSAIDGGLGESVEFLASRWTDHYADSRYALLYVLQSPEGTLLPSGLAIPVFPTADGDWASCDAAPGSEPIEFAGDIVFGRTDGMSAHGIEQKFPGEDYVVVGQEVFCTRGRRVPALIEELERGVESLRDDGFPGIAPLSPRTGGS